MKKKEMEEIKKQLEKRLTEAYFVFSKKEKPDFKTVEEGENWYARHAYVAEKVIGSQVDNIMALFESKLKQREEEVLKRAEKAIPTPTYTGIHGDKIIDFDLRDSIVKVWKKNLKYQI